MKRSMNLPGEMAIRLDSLDGGAAEFIRFDLTIFNETYAR